MPFGEDAVVVGDQDARLGRHGGHARRRRQQLRGCTCRRSAASASSVSAGIRLALGDQRVLRAPRRSRSRGRVVGHAGAAICAHHACAMATFCAQHLHHRLAGDRLLGLVPAVVVGDHARGGVADLGLARELRLLQVGHADDVDAPAAVDLGLGAGRELRPFHVDVGAAARGRVAPAARGAPRAQRRSAARADRLGERDVRHQAVAEEGVGPVAGAVEELVGHHDVGRLVARASSSPRRETETSCSTPSILKPKMLAR